jgi:hypothetical protein
MYTAMPVSAELALKPKSCGTKTRIENPDDQRPCERAAYRAEASDDDHDQSQDENRVAYQCSRNLVRPAQQV